MNKKKLALLSGGAATALVVATGVLSLSATRSAEAQSCDPCSDLRQACESAYQTALSTCERKASSRWTSVHDACITKAAAAGVSNSHCAAEADAAASAYMSSCMAGPSRTYDRCLANARRQGC